MKVLIRNIAMLLAVLCGTFTVYAQSGQNIPQSAEAKINVKTIQPLSVSVVSDMEDDAIKLIQGETRNLDDIGITYTVTGEPFEKVELQYQNPNSEINGKNGVRYEIILKKGTSVITSGTKHSLNKDGNGLRVRCILKSVTAAADADLGEHIHEFTITVHYADY